jgi:tetratricopeptide (TPR) repeat protein
LAFPATLKATLSGPTNWSRRRSPSIPIGLGPTTSRAKSFGPRGANRKQSPNTSAPSPWTRPTRTPPPNWVSTTSSSGRFDKSLEYLDKAILASPYDPALRQWYGSKATANFGLKNYDQAIELARQAIAINPNYVARAHTFLVAALALTGHDAEAREALKRYLALPSTGPLTTIAAWKAFNESQHGDPRFVERNERLYDGLRKAGMPEE